jgi:hypothetical protein
MHLNGWQRLGIVASVVWALAASIYGFVDSRERYNKAFERAFDDAYVPCWVRPSNDPEVCFRAASAASSAVKPDLARVLVLALVPIPLGWLGAYILLRLRRWVRHGFKATT